MENLRTSSSHQTMSFYSGEKSYPDFGECVPSPLHEHDCLAAGLKMRFYQLTNLIAQWSARRLSSSQ